MKIGSKWNSKILVVEDEKGIASLYQELLSLGEAEREAIVSSRGTSQLKETNMKFHFEVTIAYNAEEALEYVKEANKNNEPFAMGFFDVLLGEGKDGFELVKEIQIIDPNMYAVFVTAYNDRSIDSIHHFLGEDRVDKWDFINKPFNQSEITQKARNFVSLWNLNKKVAVHEAEIRFLSQQVMEGERQNAVAAVSRGVAHEFGNILMQIMGKSEVSIKKDRDEMVKAFEVILQASQRASEILDRFKNLSTNSHERTKKVTTSVTKIISETLELMSHQLKVEKVKVSFDKSKEFYAEVNGTSLTQVLLNVIINALHAMNGEKKLDIELVEDESNIQIKVRDYGVGMDENVLNSSTEAFFTTKGDMGTGLGLSICKEIIEIDHRGCLQLTNASPGVEVKVVIPKKQEVANEA